MVAVKLTGFGPGMVQIKGKEGLTNYPTPPPSTTWPYVNSCSFWLFTNTQSSSTNFDKNSLNQFICIIAFGIHPLTFPKPKLKMFRNELFPPFRNLPSGLSTDLKNKTKINTAGIFFTILCCRGIFCHSPKSSGKEKAAAVLQMLHNVGFWVFFWGGGILIHSKHINHLEVPFSWKVKGRLH